MIEIKCTGSINIELDKLIPFQGELKSLSDRNYKKLKNQMITLGFSAPFFVWKDKYLIDGHQRHKTLLKMRDEEGLDIPKLFPCAQIDAKSKAEAKKKVLSIASIYGEFDKAGVADYIEEADISVKELMDDYAVPDINLIEGPVIEHDPKEDEVPDKAPAVCKRGDLWQLGDHRLLCGDSTKAEDVARLMDGQKADMVFTDIPYNISQKSNGLRNLDYGEWDKGVHDIGLKTLWTDCAESFYYFCDDEQLSGLLSEMKSRGLSTRNFVWHKTNPTVMNGDKLWLPSQELCAYGKKPKAIFNAHCKHPFWEGSPGGGRVHPNQKPVELVEKCILASSKDSVIDWFCGSGSTLIACEKTKRKCYGMELDETYCDVIIRRWEEFTQSKAVRI